MKYGIIQLFGYVGKEIKDLLNIGDDFKGFDLIDVVAKIKAVGEVDAYVFPIDSKGGLVDLGDNIYNLITALKKPVYTIAVGDCMSIATKLLLAAPQGNRYALVTSKLMVHNPWLSNVEGDADTLIAIGNDVKKTEEGLLAFYAKATSNPQEAIQPFMTEEADLSLNNFMTLGFIDKQMTLQEATAMFGNISAPVPTVASVKNKALAVINLKNLNMSKGKKGLTDLLKELATELGIKNFASVAAQLTYKTTDGKTITVIKDSSDKTPDTLVKGDKIQLDGADAPSATLTTTDGTVITTDAGSLVTAIETAEQEDGNMEARAVKAEKEAKDLQEKLTAKETELATLKTELKETNEEVEEVKKDIAVLMAVAKATQSKGTATEEEKKLALKIAAEKKEKEDKEKKEKSGDKVNGTDLAKQFREENEAKRKAIAAKVASK